jgi:hypothetical protein
MPMCREIKMSDHTKCWSGLSPHCWATVHRAPEFRPEFHDITMQEHGATSDRWRHRQVLHDITSPVVCNSLFVTSWNSGRNSGALETAQQSKDHATLCKDIMNSPLKLLILGWVVVYDTKPHLCPILITGSHSLIFSALKALDLQYRAFKARENQLVRSGDEDQTRVWFSYFTGSLHRATHVLTCTELLMSSLAQS